MEIINSCLSLIQSLLKTNDTEATCCDFHGNYTEGETKGGAGNSRTPGLAEPGQDENSPFPS